MTHFLQEMPWENARVGAMIVPVLKGKIRKKRGFAQGNLGEK